ncbi:MAG: hypothetical protein M1834_005443 [Cirrosporium novae-zelandiae]|nr:MAG: hypothetical protein M1834_005443 [Cirrosporium novae-zelandiae]
MAETFYSIDTGRHHQRTPTVPNINASRRKPRRWPLVLRFIKGAIHGAILLPVFLHALFTILIVYIDQNLDHNLGLPASIIPSLSIVVGLMLVFRNQTSYNRFWDGRNYLTTVITCVRNLTRSFLVCSHNSTTPPTPVELADTERTARILLAIIYATKNHLRAEWGSYIVPGSSTPTDTSPLLVDTTTLSLRPEYSGLVPKGLRGFEGDGLGLPLELTFLVEGYIKRGVERGWFNAPQGSQLTVQLNTLMDAYGKMETIRLTPIPVAHLIHQKQVLALFGCVLPFALVDDMGWYAVPIVMLVIFTLYGIEGIGCQLEDPFGYDRNDIKMDYIIADAAVEWGVCFEEWKKAKNAREMFMREQI